MASIAEPQLIVWVALDENCGSVQDNNGTSIHYHPNSDLDCPPWFESANVKRLKIQLGKDYACFSKLPIALHQGVVLLEILRHQYPFQIHYATSPETALEYLSTLSEFEKRKAMVWLNAHLDVHPHTWMVAYDTLSHIRGSIFPPRDEIIWADFKIYDVKAFDRIAADMKTYRPLICFPGTRNVCCIPKGAKSVMKRSHSCSGNQVSFVRANSRGISACSSSIVGRDEDIEKYYRWMHQEFVPSLINFGEFRVFIATRPDGRGSREPYVVSVLRTCWTNTKRGPILSIDKQMPGGVGKHFNAVIIGMEDYFSECPMISYSMLGNFALEVYRRLWRSGERGFQSLDVGGRLNIGIAQDGKQLFVNELTRWYGAHQFAATVRDAPCDKICRAYTEAFAETRSSKSHCSGEGEGVGVRRRNH
ncbi:hypothetical protein EK21DRAFT_76445 [Setomelanomma holmii]|uniref:Uncharacterized protein n=1 Tax=Setomelanomma holmii TaxID=210430 RepID=A0A9P4H0K6_9PLEO|nr:hypothetical protein EK21DRAFT_76445 [Setomelanomma holmii]